MTGPTVGPTCTRCGRDWLGHEHPCATAPMWADLFGIDPTFTPAQRCTCREDAPRGGGHWADCPTDTAVRALQVVCEVAFQWAGEYGYAIPERATEVWDAAKLLRPDLEPTDDD